MKKVYVDTLKNIFYTLFDRRVSADRVHNVDRKNKKSEKQSFSLSVPYDILFSNEFLKDLSRLWSLRDILPDPNNMPWGESIDKKS